MIAAEGRAGAVTVLRLQPGEDLRAALLTWAVSQGVEAAAVLCAVGSLSGATLRFAGRPVGDVLAGDLELCTLSGTLSRHGVHLHATVSDARGAIAGGHVLEGCTVRTTMEVTVLLMAGIRLLRKHDAATGYVELVPEPAA
jgi:predicted DNA-binding protein with PD1-like motif